MICKNCGNRLNEIDTFCSNCGTKKDIILSDSSINTKKKISNIIFAIVLFILGILCFGFWIVFGPFLSYFFMIPAIIVVSSEIKKLKINSIFKIVIIILVSVFCIVVIPLIFIQLNTIASNNYYELDEENLKNELGNYQVLSEKIIDYKCYDPCYSFRTKTKEYEISFKDYFNNNIIFKMNDDWGGKISGNKNDILDIMAETQLRNNYNLNDNQIKSLFNIDKMQTNLSVSVGPIHYGSTLHSDLVKNYKNDINNCRYNFNFYVDDDFKLTENEKEIINNKLVELYKSINTCSIYNEALFYIGNIENIKQIYDLNYNGTSIDWELSLDRLN